MQWLIPSSILVFSLQVSQGHQGMAHKLRHPNQQGKEEMICDLCKGQNNSSYVNKKVLQYDFQKLLDRANVSAKKNCSLFR